MVYGAIAILSVLILVFYLLWEKKKERNFLYLISCVAAVNCGYFLLSTANTLTVAMVANGISYFGAAYSVLSMLFKPPSIRNTPRREWPACSSARRISG